MAGKNNNEENKDYLDEVAKTISVVAILIATVTFTAAFTLPGGLFQDGEHKGSPILKNNAAFRTFLITDSLSFILSASAVIILFLSSVFNVIKWVQVVSTSALLVLSALSTLAAMGFMVIAFGTGIYAVLGASKGLGVSTLVIVLSFFLVCIVFIGIAVFIHYNQEKPESRNGIPLVKTKIPSLNEEFRG